MDPSPHKDKYKHKTDSVDKIKERRGQEVVSLRKEKRDKIVSSKRCRFDASHKAGGDHGFTEDVVVELTKKLQHSDPDRLKDLKTLRQACAQGTQYIDAFFKVENSLQCIVGFLTGSDVELQQEAAWCLTNVSAGSSEHAMAVAKMAAPYLITFLSSNNHSLQDQCAWALGNLAGDSPDCRNLLHDQGIVAPLVKLLQSPCSSVAQSSAFALSNITRESPEITRELVEAGIIQMIPPFLHNRQENRGTLAEVAWILTYLTTTGEHVPALIEKSILAAVVELLVKLATEHPVDVQTVTPLLRCLGNICSGPEEYSLKAVDNPRLLHTLGVYLDSSVNYVVKETLWVFSNMAGEPTIATSIAYGPLLESITNKLTGGHDIKHEALYVLNNMACHGQEACDYLLEHHVLQSVIPILKSHDVELLNLALGFCEMILRLTEAGYNIFEKFEGVARLEGLEYHSNTTISTKAHELLDTYFLIDKEHEESPHTG
ncbi:uncharacterized protein LOC123533630 [Mercenaria mercenaria]|uniref:uncharacterized protein LOC123533630 n=1 Tax=Mercenaria mercenaria TaxID=6596 RepID=UPI00234EB66F|nr:uncharacterized protein LOC123533630 [Mercenaria mercenaria]